MDERQDNIVNNLQRKKERKKKGEKDTHTRFQFSAWCCFIVTGWISKIKIK